MGKFYKKFIIVSLQTFKIWRVSSNLLQLKVQKFKLRSFKIWGVCQIAWYSVYDRII